jgi:hypothetical protein
MSETCPTVDINRDGVRVTINESDLQKSDIIWSDKPTPKPKINRTRKVTK